MTLPKELVVETLRTVLDTLAALPGVAFTALVDRDGARRRQQVVTDRSRHECLA